MQFSFCRKLAQQIAGLVLGLTTLAGTSFAQLPGDPAPAGAPPTQGSVLIYSFYASSALNPALENTDIELTNNHSTVATIVHLYFIDGNSCAVADLFVCLAPGETFSFNTADYDPGVKGYLAVFSSDGNGVPNNFNFLSGSAAVKLASGHHAEFDALAINAIAAVPATADFTWGFMNYGATVRFDSIHYARVPRVLELDPVYSTGDGAETILVVNSLSGSLVFGITTIGAYQGILSNHDTGSQFSFAGSAGCQLNQLLSDAFPLTSPVFSAALPAKDDGNLKLWASADQGICGLLLNRNPKKKGKKFNSGDNLRAVTFTSSSLIVPIILPGC
jgi:hypothetical protein